MADRLIMKLSVRDVRTETRDVIVINFLHPRRPELPAWSAGAHVDVHLPDGSVRQYSLCGDPKDRSVYTIAVKREADSRGGSAWLHDNAVAGLGLHVSAPRNHFDFDPERGRHVLVAGGIGITPFVPMVRQLVETGKDFVLHYCMRSRETAPLVTELEEICGAKLRRWISEEGTRLDVATLLSAEGNSELYVCGPLKLISAAEDAALHANWPEERLHMERFTALEDGDFQPEPFDVVIASTGKEFEVPADRSLLSVLNENGLAIQSTCETGVCGTCECKYLEGKVQHRDVVLTPQKRKSKLMLCVSRGKGTLVLDL
ncbi:hypothetical protein Q675_24665 [Labrenzia sp. C1B70]|nr:hypothetical protein Q675_24665 [Labrenzia sp. C1B70]